ncbi:dihydrodipicolinate synthase family protein [Azospirillum himalayense]|uniref:Dihydrodipicolinate synthase family protein n=1 Tax=Azospirillum himalayense TaxID=654847 RepID=A0ABW0GHW9_9PROT
MSSGVFRGIITPVPTIVQDDGQFDQAGMAVLIDRLLQSKVNGLLFLGSAGEFFQFPTQARKAISDFCVARVAGRRPCIVGTAACSTAEVIELGRHAGAIGADGVIVVNPYYAPLTEERLYTHYRTVAEAVELPVLLYNFPGMTGQDLSIELVARLARDCPTIVGIKDTVDCASHTRRLITEVKAARPDFLVFAGYDEYLINTLMLGGDGAIPATSNFAPEITCGLYDAFLAQDYGRTAELMKRLAVLSAIYNLDTPFAGVVKEAIRMTGSDISTGVVPPFTKPGQAIKDRLADVLVRSGVLPAPLAVPPKPERAEAAD